MSRGLTVAAGLACAFSAWWAVVLLLGVFSEYLTLIAGLGRGGDVEGPWVVLIYGGAYAIALLWLAATAVLQSGRRLGLLAGVVVAMFAEYGFVSYLHRTSRFMTDAYLELPITPAREPLVTSAQFSYTLTLVIALHVAAFMAWSGLTYVILSWKPGTKNIVADD